MSPHECGLATPWLMEKVGGSGNSQGFTLGYSRDRPIRGSKRTVSNGYDRIRLNSYVKLYPKGTF